MTSVDIESLRGFLDGLRPQLELARLARGVESELDRRMARQFNVLDYIRTSEMGLSRVIADLLNPNASHGQGALFLDVLLRGLKRGSENRPLDVTKNYGVWEVKDHLVSVETERTIPGRRRLDVWVEIGVGDRRRCLAIENKPYAGDGGGQVTAYLDYLENKYGDGPDKPARHCLIYLPGSGEMPAKWSIDDKRKEKERGERDFAVMPYCRSAPSLEDEPEEDDSTPFLIDYTLADWFRDCRRACDVDRLRWFLADAESFCERRFGGNTMTDAIGDQINGFLMERAQLDVVAEVARRWRSIRVDVLRRFADRVRDRILKELGSSDVRCEHDLDKLPRWTGIAVYRDAWRLAEVPLGFRAEAQWRGATNWIIGVRVGPSALSDALQSKLANALGTGQATRKWPWFESVDEKWRNWDEATIVKLEHEQEAEDYFVRRFCKLFEDAAGVIDEAIAEARLVSVAR